MCGPNSALEVGGVARGKLGHHGVNAGIGHLERRQQRAGRLLLQRVGAAIGEKPTLRHGVRGGGSRQLRFRLAGQRGGNRAGLLAFHLEQAFRPDLEDGRRVHVAQRRHGADAGEVEVRAAELHRERVVWRISRLGVVAAGTGLLARSGERWIEEELLAQLRHGAERHRRIAGVGTRARRVVGEHRNRAGARENRERHEVDNDLRRHPRRRLTSARRSWGRASAPHWCPCSSRTCRRASRPWRRTSRRRCACHRASCPR